MSLGSASGNPDCCKGIKYEDSPKVRLLITIHVRCIFGIAHGHIGGALMELQHQDNSAHDINSILSDIEIAIGTTQNPRYTDKLIWVRSLLKDHIARAMTSNSMQ